MNAKNQNVATINVLKCCVRNFFLNYCSVDAVQGSLVFDSFCSLFSKRDEWNISWGLDPIYCVMWSRHAITARDSF